MQPGDCSTATTPNGSACVKSIGRRLFQFRDHDGNVRQVTARDVNRFLREIAGVEISLKDFRTLFAFVSVLEALAPAEPTTSQRARRRQVLDAIRAAADALGNTPAICGKSCVHETVVTAFEQGTLEQFADMLRRARSTGRREKADTSSGERRGRSPAGAGMNGTRA